jgi:glycosyltransferase involved in cell wall biosynthesis
LLDGANENPMPTLIDAIPHKAASKATATQLAVALLTGGVDRHYAYGLAIALNADHMQIDVIGNDAVDSPEMHSTPGLTFFNLWPPRAATPTRSAKVRRILRHYWALARYAATARPRIFHILWNSKIAIIDRVVLMLYYRGLGKKIAFTAHNVNQARRDSRDSWLNRFTLKIQYRLANQIFVHTGRMKSELIEDFGVPSQRVTILSYPNNNAFPVTGLTPSAAKARLGLSISHKTILCFGKIKPYKGIEYLFPALQTLAAEDDTYRLVIAGEVQKDGRQYLKSLMQMIPSEIQQRRIILKTEFIPDEEMEVYFKAADVLVLPYKEIFQSGVLFLGYSFGLPVIVTDVGSFKEDVVVGKTGYVCKPDDPADLAKAIGTYFASGLYHDLGCTRQQIKSYSDKHHSWEAVADLTRSAYEGMLGQR